MILEEILKKTPWPPSPEKVRKAMNQIKVDVKGLKGGPCIWTKNNHYGTFLYDKVYRWDTKKNGIVLFKDWTALEIK